MTNIKTITGGADTGYQANISDWAGISGVGMVHPSQQPWGTFNLGNLI